MSNGKGYQTPPRGEKMPETLEAWKDRAMRLANLVEKQRDEINMLKQKNNKLQQKRSHA